MMEESLHHELQKIIDSKLYRTLNIVSKKSRATIFIDGKKYINFGSNDYLGISMNKHILETGKKVLEEFGSNICSAQTLCGYSKYHENLSKKLKSIFNVENVLLFSSGYMANLSVFSVFPKEETEIFMDIYNHRSLIDGARLAGAKLFFYKYLNYEHLRKLLKLSKSKYKIIATDSVFSMEGTIADIPELLKIQEEYETFLVVDDAHGFLVLKNHIFDHFNINISALRNLVYIATLSKATGNLGGFALGDKVVLELIKNKTGTFLFDTALPPHICAMSEKAVDIILKEKKYIDNLHNNINFLNANLGRKGRSPIFIIKCPDIDRLNDINYNLLKNGIYVPAIRPPTVPQGESRLRISVCANHTKAHLRKLIQYLK